ncbi:MAG TPA: ABC transporter ATP-binding protein [Burkholderiales bacterium]|nr:ABC transporter ATP-binding protein [Burkholderiales bacterium]
MLAVTHLTKRFGTRTIFDNLQLTIEPGEYVAITGESGIGKSTLLNLLAGLDVPDTGQIMLDGTDLAELDDDARTYVRRARMGFVFQAFHMLPHLTVAGNVALPLLLLRVAAGERRERTHAMLEAVGLADRGASFPRELSGGELQRIAVARALIHRPKLVLADEPTGNLDPERAAEILALLRDTIVRENAIGILVTHSELAARTTHRILRLTRTGLHSATS